MEKIATSKSLHALLCVEKIGHMLLLEATDPHVILA
jgi:hypothetical protein